MAALVWDDPRYRQYFRGAGKLIRALRRNAECGGMTPTEIARTHRLIEGAIRRGDRASPIIDAEPDSADYQDRRAQR